MAEAIDACPFCGKSFEQLGRHLYRCPERRGRAYHHFLKSCRTGDVCSGCHKFYKRIELHLKNSKTCYLLSADKSSSITQPLQSSTVGQWTMPSLCQHHVIMTITQICLTMTYMYLSRQRNALNYHQIMISNHGMKLMLL